MPRCRRIVTPLRSLSADDVGAPLLYARAMIRSSPLGSPLLRRLGVLWLVIVVEHAALGADDPLAAARELFTNAYAAAEAGVVLPPASDPPALRDYVLYPYLERARLVAAVGQAAGAWAPLDDRVEAFITTHSISDVEGGLIKKPLLH